MSGCRARDKRRPRRRADKGIERSGRKGYLLTLVRVWRNR